MGVKETVLKLTNIMDDIEYGWVDANYNKHYGDFESFGDKYMIQDSQELLQNKVGVCWDQVELERDFLEKNNIKVSTYFIVYYDNKDCPTHTFLVYYDAEKYYWYEHSWGKYKGIYVYDTLKELLIDVRDKFITEQETGLNIYQNTFIYQYNKPIKHLTVEEFYIHCESGQRIDIDKL